MNKEFDAVGLKTGGSDNGFVSCGTCGSLLAHINYEMCKNIYIQFKCRCGADSYLMLGNRKLIKQNNFTSANTLDNAVMCIKCGSRLFSICGNADVYSFAVECKCGAKYNNAYEIKRNFSDERGLHNIKTGLE